MNRFSAGRGSAQSRIFTTSSRPYGSSLEFEQLPELRRGERRRMSARAIFAIAFACGFVVAAIMGF